MNRNQKKHPLVKILSAAVTNFLQGVLRKPERKKPKGLTGLIDQYLAERRRRADMKSKLAAFPPIHRRPFDYKEMVTGYVSGVASALTCELVHNSHALDHLLEFLGKAAHLFQ